MVCNCCVRVVKGELEKHGVQVINMGVGFAEIAYRPNKFNHQVLTTLLESLGMELITQRDERIVEEIKATVIELIHQMNNVDSMVRKSEYLVEKMGMSYQTLSKIFSKHEPVTLEKFILLHKMERIKELIDSDEYTLSEIAYNMDYSSVQYLSNQFKKMTGLSVSEYKNADIKPRKPLDNIYADV